MESLVVAHSSSDAAAIVPLVVMVALIFGFMVMAIKALICCKIFAKAGYCRAFGLLMLVPIADIIMAFILAFGDWPVQREVRLLRQQPKPYK